MSPVRHDAWSTVETRQRHRLIADNALCTIAGRGVDSPQVGVRFGAGDKECASVVQREEPLEIEVAPIHDVNGRRFRNQKIERIDIVHLAVGNMYKTRDVSTQVQKRMHFDRCFGASKRRPWEQRKAQVDGRGVECINRIREIETQVFFGVKLAGLGNESLRKLGIDSPVSSLVGVGQRRAPDRRPNTHVIKLGRLGRETSLDIAQTLPVGQLRECQDTKLFGAWERAHTKIAFVPIDDSRERRPRQKVHQLREQSFAGVHGKPSGNGFPEGHLKAPLR